MINFYATSDHVKAKLILKTINTILLELKLAFIIEPDRAGVAGQSFADQDTFNEWPHDIFIMGYS